MDYFISKLCPEIELKYIILFYIYRRFHYLCKFSSIVEYVKRRMY